MKLREFISILILVGLVFNCGFCCGRMFESRKFKKQFYEAAEAVADLVCQRGYRLVKKEEE